MEKADSIDITFHLYEKKTFENFIQSFRAIFFHLKLVSRLFYFTFDFLVNQPVLTLVDDPLN